MKPHQPLLAILCISLISFTTTGTASAQAEKSTETIRADEPGSPALKQKRAKIRKRIRALRAWKLTEELELDPQTAARLSAILGRYDERLEPMMAANRSLRQQMRTLGESSQPSDKQFDKQLDKLIDRVTVQQQKLWDLQRARFRDVRKVLTPRQAARLLVLLPQIDRKIQRQVRRALRGAGSKGERERRRRKRQRSLEGR